MSMEERALKHVYKFFGTEDKWYPGQGRATNTQHRATCVGLELNHYRKGHGGMTNEGFKWANGVMGVRCVVKWNDTVPSFKAMKLVLRARIRHYRDIRVGA